MIRINHTIFLKRYGKAKLQEHLPMKIGVTTRRVSAGLLMAAGAAQMAAAEMRYENGSGGSVLLYGQFNPAYQMFDDGVAKQSTVVDNVHSNSRVGLWLRQPFGTNTFSFNFETGLGLLPSSLVT
ncbi:MAG: hypothetical protein ACI8YI_002204 [Paracoccaceae bacterium]